MKVILFTLFIITSSTFFAQNTYTIQGKISHNNEPISFANVLIKNTSNGVQADIDGAFIIQTDDKNPTLIISAIGYKPFEKSISFNNTNAQNISVSLTPSLEQLNEVIIDRQSGLTRRTPYTLSNINMQGLSQNANAGGIAGSIQEIPGVSGATMGTNVVKPFIRGLGFSRVVTLYQHNKLENHQWGQDHGLGLNSLGVRSVDVIKGPASILYGSGAVGGVLIVNDDESYLNSNKLTGNIGSTFNSNSLGYKGFGSVGKKFNNLYLALDAGYENHADYKDGNNRIIGNSRFNNHTFRLHTGIHKENYQNKLSVTYQRQNLGIIEGDEMEESLATSRNDRKMQLPFQEVTDFLISYSEERTYDTFQTFFALSHHMNNRKEIEDAFDEVDLGLLQNHTFFTGRITLLPSSGFTHTFGLQGSLMNTENLKEAEEILIPDAKTQDIGLYYLSSKQVGSFYLQGGLRLDYRKVTANANAQHLIDYGFVLPGDPENRKLNTSFSGITGSAGASYRIDDTHQLKLNLATGFRAPDLAELYSNGPHPGTSRFEVGNAYFKREQSFQTDLTYAFSGKKLSGGASLYLNSIQNYIYFVNTGTIRPEDQLEVWEFRQDNARLYGAEWELNYNPLENNALLLKLNGTLTRGKLTKQDENLTFIPADQINFYSQYTPFHNKTTQFSFDINHNAKQNNPGFNELSTPSYTLFNAGINHSFVFENSQIETSLKVNNLFNKTYLDHLSILRKDLVPNVGRNFIVGVKYLF